MTVTARPTIHGDALCIGGLAITFQRTLRIPEDGNTYPLPPGLGGFPLRRVDDYSGTVPATWRERGGIFVPMYQREALWLSFDLFAPPSDPLAVKIGIGKINAISGELWTDGLTADPQDYIVIPEQPWLDGINAGDGFIRQFVAMPLGMGYTVEGQLTGDETHGGIQIEVFRAKPGAIEPTFFRYLEPIAAMASPPDMGLGAGGKMQQKIYPDPYGIDVWNTSSSERVFVHIANSMVWRDITGEEPPPTPVSAELYSRHGLPWFELYDEHKKDVSGADGLRGVKPIGEIDEAKGFGAQQDDSTVNIHPGQVTKVGPSPNEVRDGNW